jgi:hypothetical protein
MKVDPITFAVIKSGLDAIADDMAYTIVRIARSEIIKDVMDFSAALCDGDGQMVAQAKTIAQHLGAIPEAMAAVLEKFGDELADGDAVIMAGCICPISSCSCPCSSRANGGRSRLSSAITLTWAGGYQAPTPRTPPRFIKKVCASRR